MTQIPPVRFSFPNCAIGSSQPSWEMSGRVPDSTPRENDEAIADAILEQDALPPRPQAGRHFARRRFSMNSSVPVLATADDRRNGRFQWESWMVETLLDLKKLEWEEYESQSGQEHMISADVRWQQISKN
ncbi:hypothetical protein R1flu_017964 [Riccia fluitans]|uniref:Uncharacterized protein n=1 Tax=Riccia fluitans TaxID=41844 RepID=A0ABD1ZGT3_9MARC